jgi:Xaa-Pro aminopeptidase
MRRAARIAAAAHRRAMQRARPGRAEYEIEAELLYEFRRSGAQFPAYSPIVASGANACVLHYVANDAVLRDGELILIDAGCELDGYASDLTRTYPVNGRFSGAQREVYEIVLAAQRAALQSVRPGAAWNEPHDSSSCPGRSARRSRRRPTSASTCTAPGTGSASTCTTRATTSATAAGARSPPA